MTRVNYLTTSVIIYIDLLELTFVGQMQVNKNELQKSIEKLSIIENDFSEDENISEQVQALDVTKSNSNDELYDKRNILGFSFKKSQLEQFMANRKSIMEENEYM